MVHLISSFPHFWMSSISSSPWEVILITTISHTSTKTQTLPSDCLANVYQILSVPDLRIQDKHSYPFLNKNHCRKRSFLHKSKRIYSASESRGARQWHVRQRWALRNQAQVSAGAQGLMGESAWCMEHLFLHGQNHHQYCRLALFSIKLSFLHF